jgi:hypothetical protein
MFLLRIARCRHRLATEHRACNLSGLLRRGNDTTAPPMSGLRHPVGVLKRLFPGRAESRLLQSTAPDISKAAAKIDLDFIEEPAFCFVVRSTKASGQSIRDIFPGVQ